MTLHVPRNVPHTIAPSTRTDGNFSVPRASVPLEFTGERMTSAIEGQIEFEHYHRYCLARDLCAGRDALDVASGEGYGAAMLAGVARSVIGVEINPRSVKHAQTSYQFPNLRFLEGDALALPLPDASVDVVISFETLEHVSDQGRFLAEVTRVLRPGGLFVVSTPDRTVYSAVGTDPNPYHVLELTEPELRSLLQAHFSHVSVLAQRPVLGSLLAAQEAENWRSYERRSRNIIEATNGLARAVYLVAIASNGALPQIPSSIYLDSRRVHDIVQDSLRLPAADARVAELIRERNIAQAGVARITEELIAVKEHLRAAQSSRVEAEGRAEEARRAKEAILHSAGWRLLAGLRTISRWWERRTPAETARAIWGSGLFDSRYYLENNSDVASSGIEPVLHYVLHGAAEGRDPNPLFTSSYYLASNPDVSATGVNPLFHFIKYGAAEGRRPNPLFDTFYYLAANPDVAAGGINPLLHFLRHGIAEGRSPLPPEALARDPRTEFIVSYGRAGIHFPPVTMPEVSVIISAGRNRGDLEICLRSLAVHRDTEPSFEVILVDDCPGESVLSGIPDSAGLVKIANTASNYFSLTRNIGAAAARGRYLCFLTGDTIVSAGWLRSLIEALEEVPKAALAGGMPLSVDGTLQDAGWRMDANGFGHPIGRGGDPRDGAYTYRRLVDCVNGACFAIPTHLWGALGGFDPAYTVTSYEEFDLAFRAGARGLNVVYEPRSRVAHLDSAYLSAERSEDSAGINKTKFTERFAGALQRHPLDFSDEFAVRHASDKGPVLLMLDSTLPRPDRHAGGVTTGKYLSMLASAGWRVVMGPMDGQATGPEAEALERQGIELIRPPQTIEEWLTEHGRHVREVWLARPEVAQRFLSPLRTHTKAPISYYTHDLHHVRLNGKAGLHGDPVAQAEAARVQTLEIAAFFGVDQILSPSEEEAKIIRDLAPGKPVTVIPPYYYEARAIRVRKAGDFESLSDIVFVGGFPHTPNVDGALFIANEVMPRVWQERPDARLVLVGYAPPPEVRALAGPRVVVTGQVPEVGPFLDRARVALAVVRYGAGVKGKVVDALRLGVPVVTTPIGAEGVGIEPGRDAIVAEGPEALAEGVLELLRDASRCAALSAAGAELIRKRFSRPAARKAIDEVFRMPRNGALGGSIRPASDYRDLVKYSQNSAPRVVPSPSGDVAVSIIIPVYNQWRFTCACINSVLEVCTDDAISVEIILADDGSTDETVQATQAYPGLRVIKTAKNVGFLRNCNNAARHAKGRYIVFLNNDTIVLPGWLSSLYRTLEHNPDVAITGSKLIYPDGSIQEAGAVVFSDGTGYNVGRSYARDTPMFNVEREVDYISGASIMVRKTFWVQAGGFDERYKNAYCEDSDLAMTARSLGMRVLYQPDSEVVHFEHQSYADQAPTHDTTLQTGNIKLLVEKWRDVLQREHLPVVPWQNAMAHAERSALAKASKRRQENRLNVLYFSPYPSHPASHGNRATIQHFARCIKALGHNVHFALLRSNQYDHSDLVEMRAAWDTLDIIPYWKPMWSTDGRPIPFDGWYEDGLGERVHRLCETYDIDVVFCSYVFQSKLLEYVPPHVLKVIDTHDKMSNRFEMLRDSGLPLEFFSCSPEEEGAYLRRADLVIARRQEEAKYFDGVSGLHTAIVVPHFEPSKFVEKRFAEVRQIGIVASSNQINLAMVRECLERIDQRLAGGECPFEVHIAGQVKDMVDRLPVDESEVFRKPWVRMLGFVRDISAFYAGMDLILSPVMVGTGINVKTVQAMAFGMPLLTTECGSKGIGTSDPMHTNADIGALVESLFVLWQNPQQLARLAQLSRDCHARLYSAGMDAFSRAFNHPKLTETAVRSMEAARSTVSGTLALTPPQDEREVVPQ